MMNKIIRW